MQFVKYDDTVSFMAQVLDTVTYLVPQVLDTASSSNYDAVSATRLSSHCVECGKTFVSLERVNEHKALMHKTDAIMHNCKICKKSFKNERIYKAHTKSNHLNLPCSMCDKKFGSRRALNNHNKKKHENPTIDPPNFKYSDH